jgi:hypothetical protein
MRLRRSLKFLQFLVLVGIVLPVEAQQSRESWRMAVHEAGHIVMAMHSQSVRKPVAAQVFASSAATSFKFIPGAALDLKVEAAIQLAGRAAERIILESSESTVDRPNLDFDQLKKLAGAWEIFGNEFLDLVESGELLAEQFLAERRSLVVAVAVRLFSKRRLSQSDLVHFASLNALLQLSSVCASRGERQ